MSEELLRDKDLLLRHDARLDHIARDISDLKRQDAELKQRDDKLDELINKGMAPTQQRIFEKVSAIELQISDLRHSVEMKFMNLGKEINEELAPIKEKVHDHEYWLDKFKQIFVWGVVTMVLCACIAGAWKTLANSKMPSVEFNDEDIRRPHGRGE
jgi:uncharacterized protein YoxC